MINILLIEDNPGDVRLIKEMLRDSNVARFQVEAVNRISLGLERLARGGIDAVLLDLALPDGRGFPTFKKMHAGAGAVPIVLLTDLEDEDLAVSAVRGGAQDYLVKGQIDSNLIGRAVRYAVERQRMRQALATASLTDGQTGLYNRQGFLTVCEKPYAIARRLGIPMWLLFANIDGLKRINDGHGEVEGDRAIGDVAEVLRATFRASDIIGRLGGNEFVVLAMESSNGGHEPLVERLHENLREMNEKRGRSYPLTLSAAVEVFNNDEPCSFDELLARADAQLFGSKRREPPKGE